MRKWLVFAAVVVGLLAFSALVWFAGPLIAFGDFVPLDSWVIRLCIILFVWLVVGGVYGFRLWRARRGARKLEEGLLTAGEADGDSKVLSERMETALQTLKSSTGKRDFLYDLPWYIIIGPPGAGKTTALLRSGLKFPLAGADGGASIAGTGGTRYCDWWFTDEAVLVDTAGRYTTHDSDAQADKKSWLSFLSLLKRFRSKQPINGVIVAISLQDVMTLSPTELAAHSTAIRTRLIEVHQQLKIDFPVYALFTKADLVAGFNEFFGNFNEGRRRQVWGATFQTEDRKKNLIGTVPTEFDLLVRRLTEELPDRLQEEPDAISRISTFGFPAQFAMLKQNVYDFLRQIFEPNRYQVNANLRGFYFSSGTQEGTPIDQVLGAMDRSFSGGQGGQGLRQMSGMGKSYFLHDLITKVIFSETGWVSMDIRAVRRQQATRYGAMAAITFGTLLLLAAWSWSFVNNRTLLQQTNNFIGDYKVSSAPLLDATAVSDTDLMSVLPALDQLRDNPVGYTYRDTGTPIGETFGLSQRDRLVEASSVTYRGALERLFRSRLILRLENQLQASTDDPLASYEALKVYLMLGGKAPKTDVEFIVAWMKDDWANNLYPGPQNKSARDDLEQHLRAMLALDVARRPSFELNGLLIDSVQRTLTRLSIADQAYAYLKTAVPDVPLEDFNVAARSGAEATDVFETADGSDLTTLAVPALFTYAGFQNFFLPHLSGVAEQLVGEQWVRGDVGKQFASDDQLRQLGPQLLQLYSKDFVDAWNKVLGNIRLKRLPGDKPDYNTLSIISNPQTSPLKALVQGIVTETSLTKDNTPDASAATGPGGIALPGAAGQLGADVKAYESQQLQQRASGLARIGIQFALGGGGKSSGRPGDTGGGAVAVPGADVEAQFKNYAVLLDGTPSALDTVLNSLNEVYRNLIISDRDPTQAATATSAIQLNVSNLSYNASRFPPALRGIINKASQDLEGNAASSSLAQLNEALGNSVTQACKTLTSNLYPFSPGSSRDLPMGDFARLFAPNGVLDKFFASNLNSMVDMSGKLWAWKQDNPLASQLSVDSLRQFQRAAEIRDAFFPPNSQMPQVQLTVTPLTLSEAAQSATLNIDGTAVTASPTGSTPVSITWPPAQGGTGQVTLSIQPEMQGRTSDLQAQGPWDLMRFLNMGSVSGGGSTVRFAPGGRDVSFHIQVGTLANPFFLPALSQFRCPTGL